MRLEVGAVYEAADGTIGLCVRLADREEDELWFLISFVVPADTGPWLMRAYREDGTAEGNPNIVKELWKLANGSGSNAR